MHSQGGLLCGHSIRPLDLATSRLTLRLTPTTRDTTIKRRQT